MLWEVFFKNIIPEGVIPHIITKEAFSYFQVHMLIVPCNEHISWVYI